MRLPRSQQGLTLISIIFILALIGLFTLLTLKIVPIYLNHGKVKSVLSALKEIPELTTKSEHEIRENIAKLININEAGNVTPEDIKIVKHGNYLKVEIDYEHVEGLFGNLSALAEFHDELEVGEE